MPDKRFFIGMNFDDADEFLKQGDFRRGGNIILDTNDVGNNGIVSNVKGTEDQGATNAQGHLVATDGSLTITGVNTCIGTYSDAENRLVYKFFHNSLNEHSIWKWDGATFSVVIATTDTPNTYVQELGVYRQTDNILNFQIDRPVHSIALTDNLLSWIDGFNSPKTINLDEVRNYDQVNGQWLSQYESWVDAVKQPPLFPPRVDQFDGQYTASDPQYEQFLNSKNNLKGKSYQFIYRYKYNDNGYSVWSPPSTPVQTYNVDGFISNDLDNRPTQYVDALVVFVDNQLAVQQGLDKVVSKVEVAFRDLNINQYRKFKELTFAEAESSGVFFRNNEGSTVVDNTITGKPYDAVPVYSNGMAIIKDTKVYSNFAEGYDSEEFTTTNISTSNVTTTTNRRCWKWNAKHKVGLVWKDRAGRKSGVKGAFVFETGKRQETAYASNVSLPEYQNRVVIPQLNADISNAVVPDWAVSADVVRTNNLNSVFFLEGISQQARLVYLDNTDTYININGASVYTNQEPKYLLININTLAKGKIPYVRTEGDRIKIFGQYIQNPNVLVEMEELDMEVTDQRGDFIYAKLPVDNIEELEANYLGGTVFVNTLKYDNQIFEVYSPATPNQDDIYYETGISIQVNDPHTVSRALDSTSLAITEGDSWVIRRNIPIKYKIPGVPPPWHTGPTSIVGIDYNVYAMNSNDLYYEEIDKGIGRPNIALGDLDKQVVRSSVLKHGNAFVEDSNINGLDSFELLGNTEDLPNEYGNIRRIEAIDNVLISLCEIEAVSTYIREDILDNIDGTSNVSLSSKFFNNSRKMTGGFGCSHPSSVINYGQYVYWYSWNKQAVIRYNTGNGAYPISEYSMKSYFKDKARARNSSNVITTGIQGTVDSQADIVLGSYNPRYEMYYLTFPNEWTIASKIATLVNPKETIGFNDSKDPNDETRWVSFYDFIPERTGYINDVMYAFANGALWEHDKSSTRNNFYGTQYKSSITIVSNAEPSVQKVFNSLMIEGNSSWKVTSLTTPDGKDTQMDSFEEINGEYWTDVLMNKNTVGATNPLFEGDVMSDNVCEIDIENEDTTEVKLFAFNIFSQISERTNK